MYLDLRKITLAAVWRMDWNGETVEAGRPIRRSLKIAVGAVGLRRCRVKNGEIQLLLGYVS